MKYASLVKLSSQIYIHTFWTMNPCLTILQSRYHKLLKKERIKKEEKALSDALRADPSVAG